MSLVDGPRQLPIDPAVIDAARDLDKRAVAQLISVFEDSRPAAGPQRASILEQLGPSSCVVLGITGTPGSGKSSLVARIVPDMLTSRPELSIGVLAIDPSSQVSRGALLGDRTRARFPVDEKRCYFRSQAAATALGGLAPTSFQVARLMAALFDVLIVETVGIGQSELDVRDLADHVVLVIQPLGGDEIQFLKAGIIEIPDRFVINKCDDPAAARSLTQLTSSISLARPFDTEHPAIHLTSAKNGDGIADLVGALLDVIDAGATTASGERDTAVFRRWVSSEWGRVGDRFLVESGGPDRWLTRTASGLVDVDMACADFAATLRLAIGQTAQA